jgi:3-deoxy-7-phosphoheptulonate synthase
MIVRLRTGHTQEQLDEVIRRIEESGCRPDISKGTETTVIGLIGDTKRIDENLFLELPWVDRAVRISRPYKMVSREYHAPTRRIQVGDVTIGDGSVTVMAGPCSVEGTEMLLPLAEAIRDAGGQILRGGAYKPRTSPYAFQGLGTEGIRCLVEARRQSGLSIITEATGSHHHLGSNGKREERTVLEEVVANTDIVQIGTRNMKSYGFLEDVAQMTGELCLRGLRGGESGRFLRYSPDVGAIPVLKTESNLPVIFDPSHATGDRRYVPAVALAAVAAGADGLLIEAHQDPERAWSDGQECITPGTLQELTEEVRQIEGIRSRKDVSRG